MYVVCVTVYVKPGHEQDFIEATLENGRNTRREPGNVRFDILRAVDPPTQFFLYEVYRSSDDFKSHQQTEHYLKWRETVADWMAQPRQGVKHESLFPDDADWQKQVRHACKLRLSNYRGSLKNLCFGRPSGTLAAG